VIIDQCFTKIKPWLENSVFELNREPRFLIEIAEVNIGNLG